MKIKNLKVKIKKGVLKTAHKREIPRIYVNTVCINDRSNADRIIGDLTSALSLWNAYH